MAGKEISIIHNAEMGKVRAMACNKKKERDEVDVACGCFGQLWKSIHQTTTLCLQYEKHNKDFKIKCLIVRTLG